MVCCLEAVHLKLLGLGNSDPRQELAYVVALVSLQLHDLAVLRVLNHSAIAGKLLFAGPHDFLLVIVVRYALHCREGLSTVALLDTNVN